MKKYTLQELEALPTLCVGQSSDLKVVEDGVRVWLSRCGVADGEPYENKVSVEKWIHLCWEVVEEYEAESDHIVHKFPD